MDVVEEYKKYFPGLLYAAVDPDESLDAWLKNNPTKSQKLFRQVKFVVSMALRIFKGKVLVSDKYETDKGFFPIYSVLVPQYGLQLTMKGYDTWICSVKLLLEVPVEFLKTGKLLDDVPENFGEFPKDSQYGNVMDKEHRKEFSVQLKNDHELYTFLYSLENCLRLNFGEMN